MLMEAGLMRLGRLILASLTALAAYSYAQGSISVRAVQSDSLPRLLSVVAPLLIHAAESANPAPAVNPAAHAVFDLEALIATPLGGSLCLLSSIAAIPLVWRTQQRSLLRC